MKNRIYPKIYLPSRIQDQVIVKPSKGSYGRGVIKVTSQGENRYELHNGSKKMVVTGSWDVK